MASDLPVSIVYRGHFQTQYQTNHIIILCNRVDRRLTDHAILDAKKVNTWPSYESICGLGPELPQVTKSGCGLHQATELNPQSGSPSSIFVLPRKKERKRLIAGN